MESINVQVVAVLIPTEIKPHKIPHLKALTSIMQHGSGQERGSAFKQRYTILKSTILLHKKVKRWFHVMVAVSYNYSNDH